MQRKPGFPSANCNIKLPDSVPWQEATVSDDQDGEIQNARQQLINYAHSQWGFNNWSWAVTKQDLDFVDFANGKYSAGVVAFVSVTVKSLDIHRENIGYATMVAPMKGAAIYKARKCAVTNALRETLLGFGGSVSNELLELLETHRVEKVKPELQVSEVMPENNLNIANRILPTVAVPALNTEIKNPISNNTVKDSVDISTRVKTVPKINNVTPNTKSLQPIPKTNTPILHQVPTPIAKTHPMPANQVPTNPLPPNPLPPNQMPYKMGKPSFPVPANHMPPKPHPTPMPPHGVAHPPLQPVRPNSNVSYVLQPVMSGMMPQMFAPPNRMPVGPPHMFPNAYYADYGPWHFSYDRYDRQHGNVNLNFNIPPKNLVVNSRMGTVECKNACSSGRPGDIEGGMQSAHFPGNPNNQGCWIKPTIFYDGFWTEQKVKKWVAEQVEKQFPEDTSRKSSSPGNGPPDNSKV